MDAPIADAARWPGVGQRVDSAVRVINRHGVRGAAVKVDRLVDDAHRTGLPPLIRADGTLPPLTPR